MAHHHQALLNGDTPDEAGDSIVYEATEVNRPSFLLMVTNTYFDHQHSTQKHDK
jgi:hypothetical protein